VRQIGGHELRVDFDFQSGKTNISVDGLLLNTPQFLGPYRFDDKIVEFLQIDSGGSGCPAMFYALVFGAKTIISPALGNCNDVAQVKTASHGVTLSMAATDFGVDGYGTNSVHAGDTIATAYPNSREPMSA
jgi:hypothetical protein